MATERDPILKRRLWAAGGTLLAVVAAITVLAVAGVFSSDGDEPTATPSAGTGTDQAGGATRPDSEPLVDTIRVGGRPTAVAAGRGAVWVADSFSTRAALLKTEDADAKPIRFELGGAAPDVAVAGNGAWYALPEQRALERRDPDDVNAPGELLGLDEFPNAVGARGGEVWALSERNLDLIDTERAAVTARHQVGGFASSVAIDDAAVWVVVDNARLVRVDRGSGETQDVPTEIPEAFNVAVGEGAVWVVTASGELTRVDPGSLEATPAASRVRGALDVAAGLGSVWVTSSDRTVTRLDPETLEPIGDPLEVGDEPAGITVGGQAVWVANGGDGTLSRIEP